MDKLEKNRGSWFHIAWNEVRPDGSRDQKFAALMEEARRYNALVAFIDDPAGIGLFGMMP